MTFHDLPVSHSNFLFQAFRCSFKYPQWWSQSATSWACKWICIKIIKSPTKIKHGVFLFGWETWKNCLNLIFGEVNSYNINLEFRPLTYVIVHFIFKPPHFLENCNTPKSDSIAPVGCAESVNHLAYQLHIKFKFKSSECLECLEMRFLQIHFKKKLLGNTLHPKHTANLLNSLSFGHACCLNVAPENSKAKCIQASLEQAVSVTETLKSCKCYRSERCNKRTPCNPSNPNPKASSPIPAGFLARNADS